MGQGVCPGNPGTHPTGIVFSLADRSSSSTIRMDALAFLQGLLGTEPGQTECLMNYGRRFVTLYRTQG